MTVDASRGSMVSRSIRLHEDTLRELEKRSSGKGITVLIREILESWLSGPETFYGYAEEGPRDLELSL